MIIRSCPIGLNHVPPRRIYARIGVPQTAKIRFSCLGLLRLSLIDACSELCG